MSEQSGNGPANPVSLWRRGLKPAGTAFGIGSFVGNRRSESSSIQGTKLQSEATTTKRRTELEVLREAAEKGNASDQYHFGRCYENSLSLRLNPNGPVTLVVPQDYAEAIKWYRKAAEQDFFMAQAELGRMLYAGLGSPQNYQEAFRWFRNAAEQGSIMGQFGLGVMYEFGEIVVQDKVEAYKWYSLAAAEGKTEVIKYRDNMMRSLTPEQIAEGQRRAAAFVPRKAVGR